MHVDLDPAPRLPVSRGERSVVLLLAIAFVALLGADLAHGFNIQKLGAVFVLAFWLPVLGFHALGHALAARLVGYRLMEIGVGFGRELGRFRVGSVRVLVRTLPLEGYVLAQPGSAHAARARRALVHLGGPLANLVLLGLLAPVLELRWVEPGDGIGLVAAQSLALSAALGALYALLPYRAAGNPSDGLALLECVFASSETSSARHVWPLLNEARRQLYDEQPAPARALIEGGLTQQPSDPRLLGMQAVIRAAEGDAPGAYAALEALGPPDARAPELRAELIANAAWAVLLGRDQALLGDAQRAADRASELCPDEPHYQLLSARAAFERDRLEDAYARFMSAYQRTRDADQETQCIAYLALICRALRRAPGSVPFGEYAIRFEVALRARAVPAGLRQRVLDGAPPVD